MKNDIIKRFAGVLAFLMLVTQISIPVYAATGACSGHDGVDCAAGSDTDGSVICDDGWLDSSVDYVDMEDECGADYLAPVPMLIDESETEDVSGSGQEEEPPMETVVLSEEVDETNVVEVVSEDVDDAAATTIEGLIDQAVEEVLESLEGESTDEVADALEELEDDVQEEISSLQEEMQNDPRLRLKIMKRIEHLKTLHARLRAKLIHRHKNLIDKVVKPKNLPALYEIRWGNLTGIRQKCRAMPLRELKEALSTGEMPEKCEVNKVEYTGKISVDMGDMEVKKKVLFEANDDVIKESGKTIEFNSVIAGHWDGLVVEYLPYEMADSGTATSITVSIGDLNKTFVGNEILGRKQIGNGHFIEFRHLGKILPSLSSAKQGTLLANKVKIQEKIGDVRQKLDRIRLVKNVGVGATEIESILDEAGDYNFDDTTYEDVIEAFDETLDELGDDESLANIDTDDAMQLRKKMAKLKEQAKLRKFKQKLIPFKDTDDDQWYTNYVSAVKNRGIISGYKDTAGNELGEFRPANNITVAEILKIGLETADKGTATGNPALHAALNHWAKGYVKRAEELGVDLVDGEVDLNRPATRGEVVRLMLEALGIKPDTISKTSFSDLPITNKNAKFIEYAKALGIVSGDAGKTTFRPDAPINRAEAAKIADQINEIIIGGWDSMTE